VTDLAGAVVPGARRSWDTDSPQGPGMRGPARPARCCGRPVREPTRSFGRSWARPATLLARFAWPAS
jgi:hypothetical protein